MSTGRGRAVICGHQRSCSDQRKNATGEGLNHFALIPSSDTRVLTSHHLTKCLPVSVTTPAPSARLTSHTHDVEWLPSHPIMSVPIPSLVSMPQLVAIQQRDAAGVPRRRPRRPYLGPPPTGPVEPSRASSLPRTRGFSLRWRLQKPTKIDGPASSKQAGLGTCVFRLISLLAYKRP